jgi:hypothetical protein
MGKRIRVLIIFTAVIGVGLFIGNACPSGERTTAEEAGPPPAYDLPDRVRVEVLNAGGVPGVAWEATVALRDRGFDVVSYGNAGTYSPDSSVVLDRVGDLATARLVGEALGILRVDSDPDSTLFLDITVRLGPEWAADLPPASPGPEPRAWWDPRGWFGGGADEETRESTGG